MWGKLHFILGALALAIAGPLAAEQVTVGARGGFYCADRADLAGIMAGKFKDAPGKMGPSCKPLAPATSVEVKTEHLVRVDDMAVGRADIDGKEDVAFIVYAEKPKLSSEGRTFKRVSPNDVRNTPDKWQGRDIEFASVNVYWVGDDDIRMITSSGLTLFATAARGDGTDYYREGCETQDEALSRRCQATVRFRFAKSSEDKPNGYSTRVVIESDDVEIIRPARRRQR